MTQKTLAGHTFPAYHRGRKLLWQSIVVRYPHDWFISVNPASYVPIRAKGSGLAKVEFPELNGRGNSDRLYPQNELRCSDAESRLSNRSGSDDIRSLV